MPAGADRIPGISIDAEELIKIRGHLAGLTLAAIRRRASYRSGARDTRSRGRGMEYEETRAYFAGDDMRTMDWRVMARTGEAHTKIFAEEKERRFLLALDLSPSMYYGTGYAYKTRAAAIVAAYVGWLASYAGDRIGGLVATPESHHEIRPGKTRSGLLGLFHHLAEASRIEQPAAGAENRLNFLLRELKRVVRPGSIIALISDFIGLDDSSREIVSTLAEHNDINLFWIHDDTETGPWPRGHYPLVIGNRRLSLDMPGGKALLEDLQSRHRGRIETLASSLAIPLFPISCNRDVGSQIMQKLGAA